MLFTNSGQQFMTELSEKTILPNPFSQFTRWYEEAEADDRILHANAVCLATVDEFGQPDCRMVLLKEFSADGFVFFTNLQSRKGRQLQQNPGAALVFYWPWLNRQVRVRGIVVPISDEQADVYFAARPRGSQLGAWASKQSEVLENRDVLEEHVREFDAKFEHQNVSRPPHWSGLRLIPDQIEFWQERDDRLHDRFTYQKTGENTWDVKRLYP